MVIHDLGDGRTNTVPVLEELEDPDLGGDDVAPPAYGEFHDQLQLSQPGLEAGAAVTTDGRVTININQKDRRLSELLAPTLRRQLAPETTLPEGPLPPPYIPASLGGQPGQTPPPRLNVVIQIVGSRGDVQPFVALGQVLRDTYGHRVRIATHPTFQQFVEENGLEFFSIGGDPAELMAFMVKNPGLMPGVEALKSGEIKKRRQGIETILKGTWRSCIEAGNGLGPPVQQAKANEPVDEQYRMPGDPRDKPFIADAIIANPPSFGHINIAEKLGIPLHIMFTMPWSPTRAFPHPLANIESTNTDVVMTNYISYAMVEMMTWQGLGDVINRFRTKILDLEPLSLIWAPGILSRLRIPTTYCWSPALIPKPADWAAEVTIAGFYFLNLASSYTPPPDLAAFLAAGPPPVYIGFGSIVVDNPNFLTRTIFDAVSMAGVRALVSKGWGGLGADSVGIPDNVFMLGNCPHDWLFQHVSAVVHHGGAGTSAAGIKCGKPTVVVPFFGDQPFWGAMIARAGAGPAPIPFTKLNSEALATAIAQALKPETLAKAEELGAKIREERGADIGGKSFHEFLKTDDLRCSLAPSRAAVWRVRRAKTRLSPLAAAVLVREGVLKYSDMKLYRPIEYNTEEQPWDPISAVSSALVGDLGTMAMAAADFPREMFEKQRKKTETKSAGPEVPAAGGSEGPDKASVDGSGSSTAVSTSTPQQQQSNTQLDKAANPLTAQSTISSGPGTSALSLPTDLPSPGQRLSPQPSQGAPPSPSRRPSSRGDAPPTPAPNPFTLENAIGASDSVANIVGTGMKMPMNVCMGLARGFRNAPRLYNDESVRPTEKVTDFASGLRVAGKEFGLGFYDGLSGLVTHPLKGAEKEGGRGLLKGIGKGIGGLVLKPAAAIWALPAYTMQGVHAEVRNIFARSSTNYIIASRVAQGQGDLDASTTEEQKDILLRWHTRGEDLKGFYSLKQKEKSSLSLDGSGDGTNSATPLAEPKITSPPQTGWLHTRNLSFDERRKLHEQKAAWKQQQKSETEKKAAGPGGASTDEDEEFERAIRESVKQTSKGDKEEDARIEAAIRASIAEMRHVADEQRSREQHTKGVPPATESSGAPGSSIELTDDEMRNITDEEYQALVEEAVRRSLLEGRGEQQGAAGDLPGYSEEKQQQPFRVRSDDDDDEVMRRAMEESSKEHRQQLERHQTEEDVILEYIKKQSLAEEEFRKSKGKGKAVAGDEEDEDLRRALEESMRFSGHGGGEGAGPSRDYGRS
ncbi:glycosyltransferase family 28 domain-containing protein [Podospora conica]|nr:glycosyltransferase family 28 domain-containing protein [Schizothecium conicum]